jgi:translation initiation factor 5B
MAPKKKGGKKKADDNWEDDLGESIDPIAQAAQQAKADEDAKDAGEDGEMAGGLLAALRKNRGKKVKKGKAVNDFVDGEDATADGMNGDVAGDKKDEEPDLASKAPQEATFDDEDVFGQPMKGKKGGKAAPAKQQQQKDEDKDDEEAEEGGRVKTKKEKEKERKEREKQRKKEQVCSYPVMGVVTFRLTTGCRRPRKKGLHQPKQRRSRSLRSLLSKRRRPSQRRRP